MKRILANGLTGFTVRSVVSGAQTTTSCVTAPETLEHERDLYTGIQLALLFTPRRCGLVWRRICRDRIRERADGPQEPSVERYGRVRYPVF